jgi:DNA-binding HxlR family transcriptional regulator
MALFDLLGRRWAMGVLWTLCEIGPATFRALAEQCDSISPTVLNARLKELQAARFVEKSSNGYVATDLGRRVYEQLVPLGETARLWGRVLDGERSGASHG